MIKNNVINDKLIETKEKIDECQCVILYFNNF